MGARRTKKKASVCICMQCVCIFLSFSIAAEKITQCESAKERVREYVCVCERTRSTRQTGRKGQIEVNKGVCVSVVKDT